jgi:hypothetical protein
MDEGENSGKDWTVILSRWLFFSRSGANQPSRGNFGSKIRITGAEFASKLIRDSFLQIPLPRSPNPYPSVYVRSFVIFKKHCKDFY